MEPKYQILSNVGGSTSVIEQIEGKANRWRITVPDTGDLSMAIQLCRLLNDEAAKLAERRQLREADGLV